MSGRTIPVLVILGVMAVLLTACRSSSKITRRFTGEDKQVFDLIERLKKNPSDKEAADELPDVYRQAADVRRGLTREARTNLPPGDRYIDIVEQLAVMKRMYDEIKASPAASRVVPDPWNPDDAIQRAKTTAAEEYYNQGLSFMNYKNRTYAQKALDMFEKANKAIPGYDNVISLLAEAEELATVKVVVKPVNYNNYGFDYWGFENDFLQMQMIRDLNASSFRNARFYSDWEARSGNIQVDKVVDLNFITFYIGQVYSRSNSYNRSARIQVGTTKSIPPKPVYQTVTATVFVTTRIIESNASLECRIYDWPTGQNILYDRFPGRYTWQSQSATFRGDQRALTPQDIALINSSIPGNPVPSRREIANRLINESYNLLLSRIQSGVQF